MVSAAPKTLDGGRKPERILLIRITALGDLVLVEPVVRALRSHFPGVLIDLVSEARFADFASEALGVDTVVGYDRHGRDRGWFGMKRMIERLPARRYDLVIDLQGKLRTGLLARRVPAERRLVLRKRGAVAGLKSLFGEDPPITDRHAAEIYLSVLSPLGISYAHGSAETHPRLSSLSPIFRSAGGIVRIGLSPGATHATKRWPEARFAELADRLARAIPDARLVLIGGAGDRDLLQAIRRSATSAVWDDVDVGAMDVVGLSHAIASLDLLVSVDTGPAHIAAAMNIPVVVIFGPTSPERWGPRGGQHRVVSLRLGCSPCSNIGGPRCPLPSRSHECMEALDVDTVMSSVVSTLGRAEVETGALRMARAP